MVAAMAAAVTSGKNEHRAYKMCGSSDEQTDKHVARFLGMHQQVWVMLVDTAEQSSMYPNLMHVSEPDDWIPL